MIGLNNAKNTTTKTGNGTAYAIGAAVSGNVSVEGIADGTTTIWRCANTTGTIWEIFIGTFTISNHRVTRTQFLNSITGSPIVWTSGTKHISLSPSVEQQSAGTVDEIVATDNAATGARVHSFAQSFRDRINAIEDSGPIILTGETTDDAPTDLADGSIVIDDASSMFVRAFVVGHRESDHSGCIFEIKAGLHRDDGETPSLPGTATICNEIVDTICQVSFDGDEVNEQQSFQFFDDFSGGDFTITLAGQTTDPIGWDADSAEIEAAITDLSNVVVCDVTGGPPLTDETIIEITDPAATNFAQLMLDISGLTGGSIAATVETTTEGEPGLDDALVGYWKLDEESGTRSGTFDLFDANDSIGFAAGVQNNAAHFESGQSHELIGNDDDGDSGPLTGGDFSMAIWFKCGSGAGSGFQDVLKYSSLGQSISIGAELAGGIVTFSAEVVFSGPGDAGLISSETVTVDEWVLLVVVLDDVHNELKFSVNSAAFESLEMTGSWITASSQLVVLNSTALNYDVDVDEIGLWRRAINESDVAALYNAGAGTTTPFAGGTNEVHELTYIGSPVQGWGVLTIDGDDVLIPFNASAATAETAINAVLGAGSVDVTGGPLPGTPLVIEFIGSYAATDVDDSSVDPDPLKYAIATIQNGDPGQQPADVDIDVDPDTGIVSLLVIGQDGETFTWKANVITVGTE